MRNTSSKKAKNPKPAVHNGIGASSIAEVAYLTAVGMSDSSDMLADNEVGGGNSNDVEGIGGYPLLVTTGTTAVSTTPSASANSTSTDEDIPQATPSSDSMAGNGDIYVMPEGKNTAEKHKTATAQNNANVNKKRRELMSVKIHTLADLLPEEMRDPKHKEHLNVILTKTIEYVKKLQLEQHHTPQPTSTAEDPMIMAQLQNLQSQVEELRETNSKYIEYLTAQGVPHSVASDVTQLSNYTLTTPLGADSSAAATATSTATTNTMPAVLHGATVTQESPDSGVGGDQCTSGTDTEGCLSASEDTHIYKPLMSPTKLNSSQQTPTATFPTSSAAATAMPGGVVGGGMLGGLCGSGNLHGNLIFHNGQLLLINDEQTTAQGTSAGMTAMAAGVGGIATSRLSPGCKISPRLSAQQQQQLSYMTQTIIVNGQAQQIVVPSIQPAAMMPATSESSSVSATQTVIDASGASAPGAAAGCMQAASAVITSSGTLHAAAPGGSVHPSILMLPTGQIVPVVTKPDKLFSSNAGSSTTMTQGIVSVCATPQVGPNGPITTIGGPGLILPKPSTIPINITPQPQVKKSSKKRSSKSKPASTNVSVLNQVEPATTNLSQSTMLSTGDNGAVILTLQQPDGNGVMIANPGGMPPPGTALGPGALLGASANTLKKNTGQRLIMPKPAMCTSSGNGTASLVPPPLNTKHNKTIDGVKPLSVNVPPIPAVTIGLPTPYTGLLTAATSVPFTGATAVTSAAPTVAEPTTNDDILAKAAQSIFSTDGTGVNTDEVSPTSLSKLYSGECGDDEDALHIDTRPSPPIHSVADNVSSANAVNKTTLSLTLPSPVKSIRVSTSVASRVEASSTTMCPPVTSSVLHEDITPTPSPGLPVSSSETCLSDTSTDSCILLSNTHTSSSTSTNVINTLAANSTTTTVQSTATNVKCVTSSSSSGTVTISVISSNTNISDSCTITPVTSAVDPVTSTSLLTSPVLPSSVVSVSPSLSAQTKAAVTCSAVTDTVSSSSKPLSMPMILSNNEITPSFDSSLCLSEAFATDNNVSFSSSDDLFAKPSDNTVASLNCAVTAPSVLQGSVTTTSSLLHDMQEPSIGDVAPTVSQTLNTPNTGVGKSTKHVTPDATGTLLVPPQVDLSASTLSSSSVLQSDLRSNLTSPATAPPHKKRKKDKKEKKKEKKEKKRKKKEKERLKQLKNAENKPSETSERSLVELSPVKKSKKRSISESISAAQVDSPSSKKPRLLNKNINDGALLSIPKGSVTATPLTVPTKAATGNGVPQVSSSVYDFPDSPVDETPVALSTKNLQTNMEKTMATYKQQPVYSRSTVAHYIVGDQPEGNDAQKPSSAEAVPHDNATVPIAMDTSGETAKDSSIVTGHVKKKKSKHKNKQHHEDGTYTEGKHGSGKKSKSKSSQKKSGNKKDKKDKKSKKKSKAAKNASCESATAGIITQVPDNISNVDNIEQFLEILDDNSKVNSSAEENASKSGTIFFSPNELTDVLDKVESMPDDLAEVNTDEKSAKQSASVSTSSPSAVDGFKAPTDDNSKVVDTICSPTIDTSTQDIDDKQSNSFDNVMNINKSSDSEEKMEPTSTSDDKEETSSKQCNNIDSTETLSEEERSKRNDEEFFKGIQSMDLSSSSVVEKDSNACVVNKESKPDKPHHLACDINESSDQRNIGVSFKFDSLTTTSPPTTSTNESVPSLNTPAPAQEVSPTDSLSCSLLSNDDKIDNISSTAADSIASATLMTPMPAPSLELLSMDQSLFSPLGSDSILNTTPNSPPPPLPSTSTPARHSHIASLAKNLEQPKTPQSASRSSKKEEKLGTTTEVSVSSSGTKMTPDSQTSNKSAENSVSESSVKEKESDRSLSNIEKSSVVQELAMEPPMLHHPPPTSAAIPPVIPSTSSTTMTSCSVMSHSQEQPSAPTNVTASSARLSSGGMSDLPQCALASGNGGVHSHSSSVSGIDDVASTHSGRCSVDSIGSACSARGNRSYSNSTDNRLYSNTTDNRSYSNAAENHSFTNSTDNRSYSSSTDNHSYPTSTDNHSYSNSTDNHSYTPKYNSPKQNTPTYSSVNTSVPTPVASSKGHTSVTTSPATRVNTTPTSYQSCNASTKASKVASNIPPVSIASSTSYTTPSSSANNKKHAQQTAPPSSRFSPSYSVASSLTCSNVSAAAMNVASAAVSVAAMSTMPFPQMFPMHPHFSMPPNIPPSTSKVSPSKSGNKNMDSMNFPSNPYKGYAYGGSDAMYTDCRNQPNPASKMFSPNQGSFMTTYDVPLHHRDDQYDHSARNQSAKSRKSDPPTLTHLGPPSHVSSERSNSVASYHSNIADPSHVQTSPLQAAQTPTNISGGSRSDRLSHPPTSTTPISHTPTDRQTPGSGHTANNSRSDAAGASSNSSQHAGRTQYTGYDMPTAMNPPPPASAPAAPGQSGSSSRVQQQSKPGSNATQHNTPPQNTPASGNVSSNASKSSKTKAKSSKSKSTKKTSSSTLSSANQQKPYEVDTNLSNSIFDAPSRAMTPMFNSTQGMSMPGVRCTQADVPTYISPMFGPSNPSRPHSTQPANSSSAYKGHAVPSTMSDMSQMSAAFNPLFGGSGQVRGAQNGFNPLNFQAPGFPMNHMGTPAAAAMGSVAQTNIPAGSPHMSNNMMSSHHMPHGAMTHGAHPMSNFPLGSNFFDPSGCGDAALNISPIKFGGSSNSIHQPAGAAMDAAHHQGSTLYHNRSLQHSMSFLAHNAAAAHGFDGRTNPMGAPPAMGTMTSPFPPHPSTTPFAMPHAFGMASMHDH